MLIPEQEKGTKMRIQYCKKKKKITLRRLPDKRFKKSTYKYLMNTLRSV